MGNQCTADAVCARTCAGASCGAMYAIECSRFCLCCPYKRRPYGSGAVQRESSDVAFSMRGAASAGGLDVEILADGRGRCVSQAWGRLCSGAQRSRIA
jgi:hypothetical protein